MREPTGSQASSNKAGNGRDDGSLQGRKVVRGAKAISLPNDRPTLTWLNIPR